MSITKYRGFCKRMSQKLSFSFPQKAVRINRFVNSVIPRQVLEPKLVNSVRPSHSSVAPRLLGFHKVLNSVTPICNSWSDRESHVQWPKPDRWNRFLQLGQTESQFGGTETARVSQSPELGHTDLQFLVRPRITCAMA